MKPDRITILLGVILFISLFINLFMAGMRIGGSVNSGVPASSPIQQLDQQDQKLRDSLSDADKLVLKQAMDVNRKKMAQIHNELEKVQVDIRNIIKQDPLDEKSLGRLLDIQKKKDLESIRLVYQTRRAAMEKMSSEGRAILSQVTRLGFIPPQCH